MTTFATRPNKDLKRASEYFLKLNSELDLEKYKLAKYQELFKMTSFQAMHDADLAYHTIYHKCAESSYSKDGLLDCLAQEERFLTKHPEAFNDDIYRKHALSAIGEIREHLNNGKFDHLFV